jgi:hypothetical protein
MEEAARRAPSGSLSKQLFRLAPGGDWRRHLISLLSLAGGGRMSGLGDGWRRQHVGGGGGGGQAPLRAALQDHCG